MVRPSHPPRLDEEGKDSTKKRRNDESKTNEIYVGHNERNIEVRKRKGIY
jgi:hypothetical protein